MTRRLLLALPPLLFVAFAFVAYLALNRGDESRSALEGRPAPSLGATAALRDDPAPTDAMLVEPGVKLVNFWASWCAPCRVEHPLLSEIAAGGVPVIGVNYKDRPEQARAFLDDLGDPFRAIGADETGRTGIDWGLFGVPETFVIDGQGRILYRHAGAITEQVLEDRLLPLLGKEPDDLADD